MGLWRMVMQAEGENSQSQEELQEFTKRLLLNLIFGDP
jgi:hypothetical protein